MSYPEIASSHARDALPPVTNYSLAISAAILAAEDLYICYHIYRCHLPTVTLNLCVRLLPGASGNDFFITGSRQ